MPSKKVVKKAAAKKKPAKPVAKAAKKESAKEPARARDSVSFSVQPRELLEKKALDKGESINELVTERSVDLISVEDYLGLQKKQDYRNRPEIPGVFDLLIPPGTPRKLIIKLAKEHPVQIVRRDDIYVPVGVCDVERDLLAIRGDKKTIKKMEKLLMQEIDAFIEGRDARLHDYSRPVKMEGISAPVKKPKKSKA
jgi:hypothetical protein